MTITEEIYDAMKSGGSAMFFAGLVSLSSTERGRYELLDAIRIAGEKLRRLREVKISVKDEQFEAQLAKGLKR